MTSAAAPVLLWGSSRDTPIAAVCTALSRLGTPMFLVDQAAVLDTAFGRDGAHGEAAWIRVGRQRCDLERVRAAYVRPDAWDPAVLRDGPAGAGWRHACEVEAALDAWLELTPSRVVNRPSAMASNSSKPYQAALILAAGLDVPDTLLTNDLDALRAFQARHRHIVYKSASGVRSIVSRLRAGDDERLARLATCPVQFQERIPGADYRVHVIGDEVHGHRVESTADDYRYAGPAGARLHAWRVPAGLADRLRALASALRLSMAGIDLRRRADGRWVCFEVNPSPGFTYFEDDEPLLAASTARLLSRH